MRERAVRPAPSTDMLLLLARSADVAPIGQHTAIICSAQIPLDQEIARAQMNIGPSAICRMPLRAAERPGAFVGILSAAAVIPGAAVRISGGLFQLVRNDRDHPVHTSIAIRPGCLRRTS